MKIENDELVIAIMAFGFSVARGIAKPARRGVIAFIGSIIVGSVVGISAGLISVEFGLATGWQFMIACIFAIVGDRVIFATIEAATKFADNPKRFISTWTGAWSNWRKGKALFPEDKEEDQ